MQNSMHAVVTGFIRAALLSLPILAAASGREAASDSAVFHPSLGSVIDRRENARYFILSDTVSLVSARLHRFSDSAGRVHVILDSAGTVRFAILKLDRIGIESLERGIAERIRSGETGAQSSGRFDRSLLPVRRDDWKKHGGIQKWILADGSRIVGGLVSVRPDTLSIRTPGGLSIDIPDSQVESVAALPGVVAGRGRYLEQDPNGSRLFFAPTGRNLEAGQGYFADYFVFFPTLAVGVTKYFSVSGGMSILPGATRQLFYVAPKITVRMSPNLGAGAGFLVLGIPEEDDVKLGFAVATIGGNQRAVTLGAGIPAGMGSGKTALILVGAESQMSPRSKLITENWIFTGDGGFAAFSGGVRFFGERLAVDLALVTFQELWESGGLPFIPWVDFSVCFGR